MDANTIRKAVLKVLKTIQESSGLACPELKGSIKPIADLEDFDSKVWPVAIGMISEEIGIAISVDANIFRKKGTTVPLSIDEIIKRIEEEIKSQVAPAS